MDGKMKFGWVIFATLLMFGPMLIPASVMAYSINQSATIVSEPASNFIFSDKEVCILSGNNVDDIYDNRLSKSTSKVMYVDSLSSEEVNQSSIVIIDQSWFVQSNDTTYHQSIQSILSKGTPLVTIGSSPNVLRSILNSNRLSNSFPENAEAYGYHLNPVTGETVSYALSFHVSVANKAEMIIGQAYNWAVNRVENKPIRMIADNSVILEQPHSSINVIDKTEDVLYKDDSSLSESGGDWGAAQWFVTDDYYSQGIVSVRNAHYHLIDSSSTYDYWNSDLWIEVVPYWNNGYAISDVVVKGSVNCYDFGGIGWTGPYQDIIRYGPGQTSGTSTASVSLDFSYNADSGATMGVSRGWSYSISDVVVNNRCIVAEDTFDWWHDVKENEAVGHNTFLAEPGIITRTLSAPGIPSQPFIIAEMYEVTFCHKFLWWYNDYKTVTSGNHGIYY